MEQINAWRSSVIYEQKSYDVVMLENRGVYELYVAPMDDTRPMSFMFGLPMGQHTAGNAMQIGSAKAPEYIEDYLENEWA